MQDKELKNTTQVKGNEMWEFLIHMMNVDRAKNAHNKKKPLVKLRFNK